VIGVYHVPRTGGTAYAVNLDALGIDHVTTHDYAEVEAAGCDHTVTLVREPRARLVSEYVYCWHQRDARRIPTPERPTVPLLDWLATQPPVYAEPVERADEVLVTELLAVPRVHELEGWPPFEVGGNASKLVAVLTASTAEDMAIYLTAGGRAAGHPNNTLATTLQRFDIHD
jgi:hypothetical protein